MVAVTAVAVVVVAEVEDWSRGRSKACSTSFVRSHGAAETGGRSGPEWFLGNLRQKLFRSFLLVCTADRGGIATEFVRHVAERRAELT
jgi:hypothetical protein